MHSTQILWPIIAQILLILIMYGILGFRKSRVVKSGRVNLKATALDNKAWPEDVVKVSNNIDNQFEVPVVFFVLCLLFNSLEAINVIVISLAWAFVVSRYVHAYIHVGSNYVSLRMRIFAMGCVILLMMTLMVIWQLV